MKRWLMSILAIWAFTACKKGVENKSDFNAAFVKEWYYGTFKKTGEYRSYNSGSSGDKLPAWGKGESYKLGSFEVVELPLMSEKKNVSVPSDLSPSNRQRLAEGTLNRILFIKDKSGTIRVREVQYVPTFEYLEKHSYDISHLSADKINEEFSGKVIVRDWNQKLISRKAFDKGKFKGDVSTIGPSTRSNETMSVNRPCLVTTTTHMMKTCYVFTSGDIFIGMKCDPWRVTGVTNEYECYDVPLPEPCFSDECICGMYGLCGSGGGPDAAAGDEDQDDCASLQMQDIFASCGATNEELSSNTEPAGLTAQGEVRRWTSTWKFYNGSLLTYRWSYISLESGYQYKENGQWKWQSIQHDGVMTQGSTPFDTKLTIHRATPSISADKLNASMRLDFEVRMCITCKGVNFGCDAQVANITRTFNVNH